MSTRDALPTISMWHLRPFLLYVRRYLRRQFHSLRVARDGKPDVPAEASLIVYMNHPSWWDLLVGLFVSYHFFPRHGTYAPIDAAALAKYRFFERLGFFGVQQGSFRGARHFLRTGEAILARQRAALWITPQGRFSDPRERPVTLQSGLAHLAARTSHCVLLPVAVEYVYWQERLAEILIRFGATERSGSHRSESVREWNTLLAGRLAETQDALAASVIRRDPTDFEVLLAGGAGVGGIYDVGRRWRARWRGQSFRAEHEGPLT